MALEDIYKSALGESHQAGLKAVFDAGYTQGAADTEAAVESGIPAPQVPSAAEESTPPEA
jgi:hypothetical protein